jgi:hypothetical protein
MSELIQAGHHPDADQLNAFVEHTLPAHEQQQTLAHLAVCPACRQIVTLSLPSGDEFPTQQPETVRHHWFPRWRLAWAGIPALAALILLIVFLRHGGMTARQTAVPAQMADARRPVAPSIVSIPPETALNPAPPALRLNQNRAVAAGNPPTPRAEARREPASGVMGGILGGIASQPAQQAAQRGLTVGASVGGPVPALAVDRTQSVFSTPSPLPSHLAILSMASHADQRLAIDTGNHLFLSDDEGRHWKTVPSPWKGRAVSVALTSPVAFGSAAPALKMSSRPAATAASTLSGTITDLSGAVIPGATVTATNSSGALVGSVTTDSHGQYRMQDLAPGSYRIEAQASGFQTQSFAAQVAPSQEAVADAKLRVGSAAQTVTIEAAPGPVDSPLVGSTLSPTSQTLSRFEVTTDDGERWTSTDGQLWFRE